MRNHYTFWSYANSMKTWPDRKFGWGGTPSKKQRRWSTLSSVRTEISRWGLRPKAQFTAPFCTRISLETMA